jgi:thiamine phosphate synthase YjbQ (UPF0047 family)
MSITAPPLTPLPEPVIEPTVISSIPITIIAKATENSNVATGTCEFMVSCSTGALVLARQSVQVHCAELKQFVQTVRPQDWQT